MGHRFESCPAHALPLRGDPRQQQVPGCQPHPETARCGGRPFEVAFSTNGSSSLRAAGFDRLPRVENALFGVAFSTSGSLFWQVEGQVRGGAFVFDEGRPSSTRTAPRRRQNGETPGKTQLRDTRLLRLVVRTVDFHSTNTGSSPVGGIFSPQSYCGAWRRWHLGFVPSSRVKDTLRASLRCRLRKTPDSIDTPRGRYFVRSGVFHERIVVLTSD